FQNKKIIGMIHLDNIVDLNNGTDYIDGVYNSAKEDLISLQKGGVDAAIVENFFDQPYSTILTLEQIIAYTSIFSRLRSIAEIPLGVNLQQTNNTEEMAVASIIGGDFIRSETFVE